MATKKLRGLGRGLDALLGIDTSGGDSNDAASSGELGAYVSSSGPRKRRA